MNTAALPGALRYRCGHDSFSVEGCLYCEAADAIERSLTPSPVSREPVAWMWEYVGKDPMAFQVKPCARSPHEMDPHNPPYPTHWKPIFPLYPPLAHEGISEGRPEKADTGDALDAKRYRWLRAQAWFSSPLCVVEQPKKAVKLGYDCPSLFRIDEAIDAAMAKEQAQ